MDIPRSPIDATSADLGNDATPPCDVPLTASALPAPVAAGPATREIPGYRPYYNALAYFFSEFSPELNSLVTEKP
jgi:hypothetical protein